MQLLKFFHSHFVSDQWPRPLKKGKEFYMRYNNTIISQHVSVNCFYYFAADCYLPRRFFHYLKELLCDQFTAESQNKALSRLLLSNSLHWSILRKLQAAYLAVHQAPSYRLSTPEPIFASPLQSQQKFRGHRISLDNVKSQAPRYHQPCASNLSGPFHVVIRVPNSRRTGALWQFRVASLANQWLLFNDQRLHAVHLARARTGEQGTSFCGR